MVGSRDFFIKARRILSILAQEVVGGSEPENNGKNKDSLWRNTLRKLRRDRVLYTVWDAVCSWRN